MIDKHLWTFKKAYSFTFLLQFWALKEKWAVKEVPENQRAFRKLFMGGHEGDLQDMRYIVYITFVLLM